MRMKIKPIIAALLLCLTLCGCSSSGELGERYTVTALGFDYRNGITVTAEIFVTGDTAGAELERNVVSAEGDGVSKAFYNLKLKLSQNPLLDHCTAVAVGKSVQGDALKDVFDFCSRQNGLNFGVSFVSCDNAREIISEKSYNVAVGFDLVSAVESFKDTSGVDFKCRRYEIEADLNLFQQIYTLPVFTAGEKGADITSQRVFEGYFAKDEQNIENTLLYSLLCNRNTGGTVYINNEYANLDYSRTFLDIEESDGFIMLNLNTVYSAKKQSAGFKKALDSGVKELLKKSGGTDVFGFADRIEQKDKSLFEKIKTNYEKLFADGKIEVNYKVKEK